MRKRRLSIPRRRAQRETPLPEELRLQGADKNEKAKSTNGYYRDGNEDGGEEIHVVLSFVVARRREEMNVNHL